MTSVSHHNTTQSVFTPLHILFVLPGPLSPVPGHHRSLHCLHSLLFQNVIELEAFSAGLRALSNVRLRLLHVFHGLVVHFFSSLNDIPLPGRNGQPVHPPKGVSAASSSGIVTEAACELRLQVLLADRSFHPLR